MRSNSGPSCLAISILTGCIRNMNSFFLVLPLEKQEAPRPESQAESSSKPAPWRRASASERLDAAEHRATIKLHVERKAFRAVANAPRRTRRDECPRVEQRPDPNPKTPKRQNTSLLSRFAPAMSDDGWVQA